MSLGASADQNEGALEHILAALGVQGAGLSYPSFLAARQAAGLERVVRPRCQPQQHSALGIRRLGDFSGGRRAR